MKYWATRILIILGVLVLGMFIWVNVLVDHIGTQIATLNTAPITESQRYPLTYTNPTRAQVFCYQFKVDKPVGLLPKLTQARTNPTDVNIQIVRSLALYAPTEASFKALNTLYSDVHNNHINDQAAIDTVNQTIAATCS